MFSGTEVTSDKLCRTYRVFQSSVAGRSICMFLFFLDIRTVVKVFRHLLWVGWSL